MVGGLCCEPRVILAVLEELIAPYLSGERLTVLLQHKLVAADATGDRVTAVQVKNMTTGEVKTLSAPLFIDGTGTGEMLPATRTEYVTGAESGRQTGKPHAASEPQPDNIQAFTICFAMEFREGESHTIDRPRDYSYFEADSSLAGTMTCRTRKRPNTSTWPGS